MKEWYEENEIIRYSTFSELKSVFAERVNATLQAILYKMMKSHSTAKWIDFLEDATHTYNSRVQEAIKPLTPEKAHLKENESFLRTKFLKEYNAHRERFKQKKPKYKIDQWVRYAIPKGVFSPRGYEPKFSSDLAKIEDIFFTYPITYKLTGEKKKFYEQQLVPVEKTESELEKNYFIEKKRVVNPRISRSGKRSAGQTQYLLRATNDPDLGTWISETDYLKLRKNGLISEPMV